MFLHVGDVFRREQSAQGMLRKSQAIHKATSGSFNRASKIAKLEKLCKGLINFNGGAIPMRLRWTLYNLEQELRRQPLDTASLVLHGADVSKAAQDNFDAVQAASTAVQTAARQAFNPIFRQMPASQSSTHASVSHN
jgi:hypothetical protein